MANAETYKQVARCCSEFLPAKNKTNSMTNTTSNGSDTVSCECCKHFNQSKHCELDIYDKIIKEHHISCH